MTYWRNLLGTYLYEKLGRDWVDSKTSMQVCPPGGRGERRKGGGGHVLLCSTFWGKFGKAIGGGSWEGDGTAHKKFLIPKLSVRGAPHVPGTGLPPYPRCAHSAEGMASAQTWWWTSELSIWSPQAMTPPVTGSLRSSRSWPTHPISNDTHHSKNILG